MDLNHEKTALKHELRVSQLRRDLPQFSRSGDVRRVTQKAKRAQFWEKFDQLFVRRRPN